MKHVLRIAAGAALIVALAAGQAQAANPHGGGSAAPQPCGTAGTVTLNGKTRLWPPNHKMSPYTVVYSGGVEGETLASHASSSEVDPSTGVDPVDSSAIVDSTGTATTAHGLRAERAGSNKAGRVYTIAYTVTAADASEVCTSTFTVVVPHDNRGKKI